MTQARNRKRERPTGRHGRRDVQRASGRTANARLVPGTQTPPNARGVYAGAVEIKWTGTLSNGMRVTGYVDDAGRVTSAYPEMIGALERWRDHLIAKKRATAGDEG